MREEIINEQSLLLCFFLCESGNFPMLTFPIFSIKTFSYFFLLLIFSASSLHFRTFSLTQPEETRTTWKIITFFASHAVSSSLLRGSISTIVSTMISFPTRHVVIVFVTAVVALSFSLSVSESLNREKFLLRLS